MKLIFLYGLPATGKLTIARELVAITGYKLFHNHLVVDTLLSVFDFGSPPFVELREEIWLSVFAEACRADLPGLIFTFAPEATVRPSFIPEAIETITDNDGEILFVEITCPLDTLKTRLSAESRQRHGKLTSVEFFEKLHAAGALDGSHMPHPQLSIDSNQLSPEEAANTIADKLNLRP
jgi:chloramphenicol 3-O-phosphotransferase